MRGSLFPLAIAAAALIATPASAQGTKKAEGWLNWRGPSQNGTSAETKLPVDFTIGGPNHRWSIDLKGRGTAVINRDRVYVIGYRGIDFELQEVLGCYDVESGRKLWERSWSDFLSDIIYERYSVGAPAIDPETGNVFVQTSPGLLMAFTADGEPVWERSLMEEFGRLTFPNGRTGCPTVDGQFVIINAITSNWGRQGPARNRFYAFDKDSGELVWASTPGTAPKDSSFSTPVFEWRDGKRIMYAGTGCGHLVAINALTGEPIWRYRMSFGGVNSSPVLAGDRIIEVHGKENLDDTTTGRMIAVKLGMDKTGQEATDLPKSAELWRNELGMFTSSPVLVGDRVYQVTAKGELCCVDIADGRVLWKEKLATSQLHASPLYADGKLYIPMWSGDFYVIEPSDKGPKILQKVKFPSQLIGSPSVWRGRVFIHSTTRLHCFGPAEPGPAPKAEPAVAAPKPGAAARLRIIPSEVLLTPQSKQGFRVDTVDAVGQPLGAVDAKRVAWETFIPPTAKVKARLDASVKDGAMVAGAQASAGAFKATADGLKGFLRGRVLTSAPITADFEGAELKAKSQEDGAAFAFPPLPWIGARFKWEIREVDGSKVMAKTLDRVLFQRTMTFVGHPDMKDYTIQADVRSDGNRRLMSNVGVINQRYIILLEGNWQQLQVLSNHDRMKISVPFKWKSKRWYRIKATIRVGKDGSGVILGKAWPRDEKEPANWQLIAPHKNAHTKGAPGVYGFSPQSRYRVYVDNIKVSQN